MRAPWRVSVALACLVAAAACSAGSLPPRGEVALWVDTDAVTPPVTDGEALFDTLRVDVYPPGQDSPCASCGRAFPVTTEAFKAGAVSFGVPLPPGVAGYRVRLRLYPSRATLSGQPPEPLSDGTPPSSVIDVFAALPQVGGEGVVERHVFLPTDAVGLPQGSLEAPLATDAGRVTHSLVGTWAGAQSVPCSGDPQPGEVCVPGGAFWMGNAKVTGFLSGGLGADPHALDATQLRLVVLSPFFVDSDLVTVRQMRASKVVPEEVWSGQSTGATDADFCTYTAASSPRNDYPVNCLLPDTARAYCATRGATLISEAQFEYVASARRGRLFAWGEEPPASCDDAVYGRAGWGTFTGLEAPCHTPTPPGGALVVGSLSPLRRDHVELPAGSVHDLVGNLSTYVRDQWARQTDSCWKNGGVYVDPVCATPGADGAHPSLRGGSWVTLAGLPAAYRTFYDGSTIPPTIGLRCARLAP